MRCPEHGEYDTTVCPWPIHSFAGLDYPHQPGTAQVYAIPHDELACQFCRHLNALKQQHYATLTPRVTVDYGTGGPS